MAEPDPNANWLAGILAVITAKLEAEYQRGYDDGYAAAQAEQGDEIAGDE